MQLIFLLASVVAFSSLMNATGNPVAAPEAKLTGSVLACAVVIALAWWIGQLKRHASDEQLVRWHPQIRLAERLHGGAYLVAMSVMFISLDFAEIVHTNWRLQGCVWADDLVVAFALSLPLVASWLFFAAAAGVDNRDQPIIPRLRYVWLQARHFLLLPLVPVFALTGVADMQRLLLPTYGDSLRSLLGLSVVMTLAVTLPWLLRWCWPTEPLEAGPARTIIEGTLAAAQVRVSQVLRWQTRGQWANAAMSGFIPQLRYLFVTDALLCRLTMEDLRAITAHEAAHCRLRHLPRLAGSLAIPFLVLLLADPLISRATGLPLASNSLLVIGVLGVWSVWHGRWARRLEHQADLAACRLLSSSRAIDSNSVVAFEQALKATGAGPGGDWLHPSLNDRVALLWQAARHPSFEADFGRRLKLADWGQRALLGLMAIAWLYLA